MVCTWFLLSLLFASGSLNSLCAQEGMKVLLINGSKFAANKGASKGVTTGSIYLITRNNTIIGRAEVITVRQNICALKILEINRNIKIGDKLSPDNDILKESELLLNELHGSNDHRSESWYMYWGLGLSSITYPSDIQSMLNYIKMQYNPVNIALSLDLLGFYFHLDRKSIIGFVINGVGDRYEYSNGNYFQINQYVYGISLMKYLNAHFGTGFFIRGDLGLASYVYQSNIDGNYTSDPGFGIIAGGGYSIDFGGTRLLFNLNYGYRTVERQNSRVLSFSLGGLF
jgi:hypothetical protein